MAIKNIFLIPIFHLFWLISFSQENMDDKISFIFIPEKNKVIFQLYSNNIIVDSIVVESVTQIENKSKYFELTRRCGTGCKLKTILLLQNKENKIIESLTQLVNSCL